LEYTPRLPVFSEGNGIEPDQRSQWLSGRTIDRDRAPGGAHSSDPRGFIVNLLAAGLMLGYLWRTHPKLSRQLKQALEGTDDP